MCFVQSTKCSNSSEMMKRWVLMVVGETWEKTKSDFGFESWLFEILIGIGNDNSDLQVLIGIWENKGEDTLMI
jgi:hypothetical protein